MPFPEFWGHKPVEMPLVIVRGQDFTQTMQIDPSEPPPAGSVSRIDLVTPKDVLVTSWDGIVGSEQIDFSVESEITDALPKKLNYYHYIVYPDDPDLDMCISYGAVEFI